MVNYIKKVLTLLIFPIIVFAQNKTFSDLQKSGIEKFDKGDFYGAISDFNDALRINPSSDWMYYRLSYTKHALEDYENSIKDINKAIELDEGYGDYYIFKGQINRDLENFYDAIDNITTGISKLDPNDSLFYGNSFSFRGDIKSDDLEDFDSAISDYNKAIKYNPNYNNFLNRGFANSSIENYEAALLDFNKGIELYTDEDDEYKAFLYSIRASIKNNLENYYGAIGDMSKAIELDKKKSTYYQDRANYKFSLDDYKRTIPDLIKAIELNSDEEQDPPLKLMLAACTNWSGNPKRALEILEKSKSLFEEQYLSFLFLTAKAAINIGLNKYDELEEGLGIDTKVGCSNLNEALKISGIDEDTRKEAQELINKYCN